MRVRTTVDTDRYPIDQPDSVGFRSLVADCRRRFVEEAVVLLPGFLREETVSELAAEAAALVPKAFFCRNEHNVYLDAGDNSLRADHPCNQILRTDVGSIANDFIAPDSALQELYEWSPLTDFVAQVVGADELHLSADPLGALSINVFAPGDSHAWHFDEARFTVTLMVQPAEAGGYFEFVRGLRDNGGHGDVDSIRDLVTKPSRSTNRMPFEAGTLSVFAGHHTVHRVTTVEGQRPRLVPVLTYSAEPGYRNSDAVREFFWGRSS